MDFAKRANPSYEWRLTSNPEPCWLINTFIQSTNPDEVYIQSLTTDNYLETSDYVTNLKETFKDTPNLLRKYLYGDWSLTDSINQLIPSEYLQKAIQRIDYGVGVSIGIDVARYGDDKTVFTVLKEGNIELIESYNQTSITEVSTRAIELINQYNLEPEYLGVDAIGIGAGVVDNLKSAGYNVTEIVGGNKADETANYGTFKPYNLRTQIYYELRKDIIDGNLGNLYHEGLRYELQAIKYEICADKTARVISKDVIKRLLGRSPDFADSLAYANYVRTYRGEYYGYVPIYGG